MTEMLRMLDVDYTLIWRANRLEREHPEGAVQHGPEGVMQFFRDWTEPFDDLDAQWDVFQCGEDQALALIQMSGRGRESGVPVAMQIGQLWTSRDGRAAGLA